MKKRLKLNIFWLVLLLAIYGVLYAAYSSGLVNLFIDNIIVTIGINIILAVGLNLVIGFSGQFSLGHAGFILSSVVALVVGIPTLRLKGDYLAIATLGVAEIIRIAIVNMESITNGPSGLFGIPSFVNWPLVYGFVIVTTLITVNYIHSGAGRVTMGIRDDEIAAESMGVNTTKYKVIAFVIGAATASIAGALSASYIGSIAPKNFAFQKSIDILIIVVFGGIGSVTGSIVAAIVLGVLNMYLQDFGSLRMIIYSLALIIIMIFKPGGLLGTWELSAKKIFRKKGGSVNDVTKG